MIFYWRMPLSERNDNIDYLDILGEKIFPIKGSTKNHSMYANHHQYNILQFIFPTSSLTDLRVELQVPIGISELILLMVTFTSVSIFVQHLPGTVINVHTKITSTTCHNYWKRIQLFRSMPHEKEKTQRKKIFSQIKNFAVLTLHKYN